MLHTGDVLVDQLLIPFVLWIFIVAAIVGIALGVGLIISSAGTLRFLGTMNRWVSLRSNLKPMEIPRDIGKAVYGHGRWFGGAFALGGRSRGGCARPGQERPAGNYRLDRRKPQMDPGCRRRIGRHHRRHALLFPRCRARSGGAPEPVDLDPATGQRRGHDAPDARPLGRELSPGRRLDARAGLRNRIDRLDIRVLPLSLRKFATAAAGAPGNFPNSAAVRSCLRRVLPRSGAAAVRVVAGARRQPVPWRETRDCYRLPRIPCLQVEAGPEWCAGRHGP
jgi:hypothetical protein